MRVVSKRSGFARLILAAAMLLFVSGVLPVMALPPEVEADRLLIAVAGKIDSQDFVAASKDLEKIRALNIELPVEYYFQFGRFLTGIRQAVEAKNNLETYLNKVGKEGRFYEDALKLYSLVDANEKRWTRFKFNSDGTVTDTQTGLMWASRDNGADINWSNAKVYCQNYKVGGYTDWRLPTQQELAGIYDRAESNGHTTLIGISACCPWTSDTRDSEAAFFDFTLGSRYWFVQSRRYFTRALPVRNSK